MASLTVKGLTKTQGENRVFDSLDVSIGDGELLALMGPSGAGKTFFLRCLVGFEHPDGGDIFLGDERVTDWKPSQRNIGTLFQRDTLWPHMSVSQSVQLVLQQQELTSKEVSERATRALAAVGMEGSGALKPRELSGGQQQRVAIARAIVANPRCLLLDEPFAHLDARIRQELRELLRRLCDDLKLTTLLVTHDQGEALSVADRVGVLAHGRIQQVAKPAELYKRPTSKWVAGFIGENNFLPGKLLFAGAGEGLVETALGEFRGHISEAHSRLSEGDEVTLAIRPECFQLDLFPADENCVEGRIESATFLGELARYQVEVRDQTLKVAQANPRYLAGGGDKAFQVWVAPEDVVILPNDG